jgi:hypothetical protein
MSSYRYEGEGIHEAARNWTHDYEREMISRNTCKVFKGARV